MNYFGIVITKNPKEGIATFFFMRDGRGNYMPCRSAAGYNCMPPEIGDRISIIGDTIRDLISGRDTEDVYFNSLEVLESACC